MGYHLRVLSLLLEGVGEILPVVFNQWKQMHQRLILRLGSLIHKIDLALVES